MTGHQWREGGVWLGGLGHDQVDKGELREENDDGQGDGGEHGEEENEEVHL